MADTHTLLRVLTTPFNTGPGRRLINGVTIRFTVLFTTIILWVLVARTTFNGGELILGSLLALVGFVAFTSATERLMRLTGGRDHATDRSTPDAPRTAASPHDPEVLASLLLTHARPSDGVLTLAGATACLVREAGPVPLPLVVRALDALVQHQAIVPDFDEMTDQRCWRFPTPHGATRPLDTAVPVDCDGI